MLTNWQSKGELPLKLLTTICNPQKIANIFFYCPHGIKATKYTNILVDCLFLPTLLTCRPELYQIQAVECVVFDVELNRKAPMHFLVLPKEIIKLSSASYGDEHLLGHLLLVAKNVAIKNGLQETGYRIIVDEDYGTSRLKCLHVFGGPYIGTERLMGTKSRI